MENRKRIAIIIPGGIGTGPDNMGVPVLEKQVRLLASQFELTVFSLHRVNDNYTASGFELVSIHAGTLPGRIFVLHREFSKRHKQKSFQVVHGFWIRPSGFLAVLLGKIFTIKSVVSVLGGDATYLPEIGYGQLKTPMAKKIALWTLKHATECLVLTRYLADGLKAIGMRREPKVIPWGIDTNLFAYQEKPVQTPVRFLHIGNLSPVKDQETLLSAFHFIHSQLACSLVIIGRGELKEKLISLAAELGIKNDIEFLNPVSYEKLPAFYHRADILLHTSLSEGQCEVVTEAMSAGLLVCGTAVGLMYDKPDCCIAVPPRDFKTLGQRVLEIVKDEKRMSTIRTNALNFSSSHDIHWTIERVKAIYSDSSC